MHEPTYAYLGSVRSTFRKVESVKGEWAAGLALRLKNDGTLSATSSDGTFFGITLGRDLSDAGYTAVVREGTKVPLQVTAEYSPAIGAALIISNTTGMAAASGTTSAGVHRTGVLSGGLVPEGGTKAQAVRGCLVDIVGGL